MKVIFLSGPYRSETEYGVYCNIHHASQWALEIWKLGAVCLSPQKNTAFFGGATPDEVWLTGDLELMRRCDAVFAMPGWKDSSGAIAEVEEARELALPVFESLDRLEEWLLTDAKIA